MSVRDRDIVASLSRFGLDCRAVCVHSSLKSFGHVEGGAPAIVRAFLEAESTILVPSFSWSYSASPPSDDRPERNGTGYDVAGAVASTEPFTPASPHVDREMGALSATVVADPRRVRGDHPICSFSALGQRAADLVKPQTLDDVWAPLERLVEVGGAVVLMGVGLTRLTLAHLAEYRAGRRPFVRWAQDSTRRTVRVRVGGCSEGFEGLAPALEDLGISGFVGKSRWLVLPAGESLSRMTDAIHESPTVTRCREAECLRCEDAIARGPAE